MGVDPPYRSLSVLIKSCLAWCRPHAGRAACLLHVSVGLILLPLQPPHQARTETWVWARCEDLDFGTGLRRCPESSLSSKDSRSSFERRRSMSPTASGLAIRL